MHCIKCTCIKNIWQLQLLFYSITKIQYHSCSSFYIKSDIIHRNIMHFLIVLNISFASVSVTSQSQWRKHVSLNIKVFKQLLHICILLQLGYYHSTKSKRCIWSNAGICSYPSFLVHVRSCTPYAAMHLGAYDYAQMYKSPIISYLLFYTRECIFYTFQAFLEHYEAQCHWFGSLISIASLISHHLACCLLDISTNLFWVVAQ